MALFKLLLGLVFVAVPCSVQAAFVNLKATVVYDSKGSCTRTSSGVPLLVTAFPTQSTCTDSSECFESPTGSSLYPATVCSMTDGTSNGDFSVTTLPFLFGTSPYVVVENYAGTMCDTSGLSKIATYLADGKCHMKDASTSYRAVRKADQSAKVQFYTDAACATPGTTATDVTSITSTQANVCVGAVKVYGYGTTPVFLLSTKNYESSTSSCKLPTVPNLVSTVKVDPFDVTCKTTSVCSGTSAPFASTLCSSFSSFVEDMNAVFDSKPFAVVETYTDTACASGALAGIKTYWADGICHRSSSVVSYKAKRNADGSASIETYTDAACTTFDSTIAAPASQAGMCVSGTKVYGAGVTSSGSTSLSLSSTMLYDINFNWCRPPALPMQALTSVVSATSPCTASTTCTGTAAPFTGTQCSTTQTYKEDMALSFINIPFIIVEKYTPGKACDSNQLSGITTYLADGRCHRTGATASFKAVRKEDGSSAIKTFTAAGDCTGTSTTFMVTAAQYAGNSCRMDGNGIIDAKIYGSGRTALELTSIAMFADNAYSCTLQADSKLTQMVSTPATTTCRIESSCVTGQTAEPYTSEQCVTIANIESTMATVFGSTPYLVVEKYKAGTNCALTDVDKITTYVADVMCHKTSATSSFVAERKADNSYTVNTYNTADCTGPPTTFMVTAAQYTGNSCAAGVDGIVDTKIYGNAAGNVATTLTMASYATFADTRKSCTLVADSALTQLVATPTTSTCTADMSCGPAQTTEPFTSAQCVTSANLASTVAMVYGENTPYLIVERYEPGTMCATAALERITTYVADGECHKTNASSSFIVVRKMDGTAAIKTFTAAGDCVGASMTFIVSAAQYVGNSCAADANGILDTKVYGNGATTVNIMSYATFADDAKTCTLVAGSKLTHMISSPTTAMCTAYSSCENAQTPGAFTSVQCGTSASIASTVATVFGTSTPYVIMEKYTVGTKCALTDLQQITTYVADGECHSTTNSKSFMATAASDGSATVVTYTDSATCSTSGVKLVLTASQVAGNSCANDEMGVLDTKVYVGGISPQYLSTKVVYDSKTGDCRFPAIPTQLYSTMDYTNWCIATTGCAGASPPYNGTICSSIASYRQDVAAVFGTIPYVIVEKYGTGKSCNAAALSNIGTYVADTKCHRSGPSSSFRAIRKADGSATVMTYADSGSCSHGPNTLAITAKQAISKSCAKDPTGADDAKVYGAGATPLFLTVTAVYESSYNGCKWPAIPVQWIATTLSVDRCSPSVEVCRYTGSSYTNTLCSSTRTYQDDVSAAFPYSPFVTVQNFISGKGCSDPALSNAITYLADGYCHSSSSSSSFRVTQSHDGSVEIEKYADSAYCGTNGWKLIVPATQAANNLCFATEFGDVKVFSVSNYTVFDTATDFYLAICIATTEAYQKIAKRRQSKSLESDMTPPLFLLLLLLIQSVNCARSPPQLPRQFQAEVQILSHLSDPRQEYPPSLGRMKVRYDFDQQLARAEMVEGYNAGKTYVRRYDQKQEFMVKSGNFRKCERAYLGDAMPTPEIPFVQEFVAMESVRGKVCEHWMHTHEDVRVHVYSDVATNVPIRLTEENIINGQPTMLLTFDLLNVRVGPQNVSSFSIPDGYERSDCVRNVGGFPYIHAFHHYLRF